MNINDFNENNLTYVKPLLFYKVSKNMGIYYKNRKSSETNKKPKKQKIIIQTPKMIVPFAVKEFDNNGKKSFHICLSFNTMTNLYNEEDIKKMYQFVKKIDTINEDTVTAYYKDWGLPKNMKYRKTLQRLSDEFPYYMNLNLPYDNNLGFLFNVYNENAEKSTIDIIEKRSIVSVVMELTDLRFSDTEFRSNWTLLQIRKFKPSSPIQDFFMSDCFITDKDNLNDVVHSKLISRYQKHEAPIKRQTIVEVDDRPTSPKMPVAKITPYRPPTLQELLGAKSALKRTETVEKSISMGKVINDDTFPIPPPPPPPFMKKIPDDGKSSYKTNNDEEYPKEKSSKKSSKKNRSDSNEKHKKKNKIDNDEKSDMKSRKKR
jgi:hypothetical protein